jgi:hypothetical protein
MEMIGIKIGIEILKKQNLKMMIQNMKNLVTLHFQKIRYYNY